MEDSPRCRDWRRILDLTVRMRARADDEDWDAVARLTAERARHRPRPIGGVDDRAERAALTAMLGEILEIDRALAARAASIRDESAERLRTLRRGRAAHRAYGAHPPPR